MGRTWRKKRGAQSGGPARPSERRRRRPPRNFRQQRATMRNWRKMQQAEANRFVANESYAPSEAEILRAPPRRCGEMK
eukprot:777915-Pyramimonas_sp.AAC.1